jgi:sugar phosphate permease
VTDKLSILKTGVLLRKRGFLIIAFIYFIFSTSYALLSVYLTRYVSPSADNLPVIQATVYFVTALTLLLVSFFIHRFNKLRLIYASSVATAVAVVLLSFSSSEVFRLTIIVVTTIIFSIGLLALFTYFWDLTVPEERGRVAGLAGFITLPFFFTVRVVAEGLDFSTTVMLSVLLSLGTLLTVLLRSHKAVLTAKKDEGSYYFERRTVFLYLIPWILFSLINATLAKNISVGVFQQVSSSFYLILLGLQVIGVMLGAIVGGIIADFFGRRIALAFSLTLYGTSAALAGLFQSNEIFPLVYVANGISWGILLILYNFVVWGDLANKGNCAKMYSIGLSTYYLAIGFGLFATQISQISLVLSALSSCLLMFLANVPIILAPELLPFDFREKIKLRLHMNAIRRINKQSQN